MSKADELAEDSKDRREAAERKKTLLGLAKDIGFESVMFPVVFKYSSRETLRYSLWQVELYKWMVIDRHLTPLSIYLDMLESELIHSIKYLLHEDETRKR